MNPKRVLNVYTTVPIINQINVILKKFFKILNEIKLILLPGVWSHLAFLNNNVALLNKLRCF